MRIDHLHIKDFKCFEELKLDLHPNFNLFYGVNGSGKTSILDAVASALDEFRSRVGFKIFSRRKLEVRRWPISLGDTKRFVSAESANIYASGVMEGKQVEWTQTIKDRIISSQGSLLTEFDALLEREKIQPSNVVLPVLAYYDAGRIGRPLRARSRQDDLKRGRDRSDAYHNCLDGNLQHDWINNWFLYSAAAVNGREKAGFRAVMDAIKSCLPGCRDLSFYEGVNELVADIDGKPVPYYSLSAGQQVLLSMVADIAIKAETLNPQLGLQMIKDTPGIVLIDELDVHLHPTWQRRVVHDLMQAFPKIQFICTSHSPQIFGELTQEHIWAHDAASGTWHHPRKSFGLDSSRVLTEEMGASDRNVEVAAKLHSLAQLIDGENFPEAEHLLNELAAQLGEDDAEIVRARTLITFLNENDNEAARAK